MFTTVFLIGISAYLVAALASRVRNADLMFGRSPAIMGLVAAAVAFFCAVGNVFHYLTVGDLGYALAFLFAVVAMVLAFIILRTRETLTRTS
ncbi:hypothetical protein QFZ40_004367 [Arthrobacter pascens]|uniref:hypothetical protein n=1 Tax=Arthrobacter pascens TaxID=1677 RepID=UPI00278724D8|nr:hypothetical protein [Arthrobacter pascens]MDQ0636396.1 hypothetical protein [Arthrobacter pascens]